MNTTYDSNFRFNSLLQQMGDTMHTWRRANPNLGQVANKVKTWQKDWEVLSTILQKQSGYSSVKSVDVTNALEDAWDNRDNKTLSLEALEEAYSAIKSFSDHRQAAKDDFIPVYKRRSVKAMLGDQPIKSAKKSGDVEPAIRVKSLVSNLENQIEKINYVPQDNRRYIAMNPHMEGRVYQKTVNRVKAWFNEVYPQEFRYIHPDSREAVKAIGDILDEINNLSEAGMLTNARRRAIHQNIRKAFKAIKFIQPVVRTNAVKASLLQDVEGLRNRLDNTMSLLEYRNYGEDDLYRDVSEARHVGRSIAVAAPIKYMPADTNGNFYNLDQSLTQILMHRNTGVRIKALRAAAANLDVIASDLADISNAKIDPATKSLVWDNGQGFLE